MTTFKKGDVVRLLKNGIFTEPTGEIHVEIGTEGVVRDTAGNIVFTEFPNTNDIGWAMYAKELELVTQAVDPIQDAKDQAYAAGYAAGLRDGEEAGYEQGDADGYNTGYEAGQEANGW